MLLSLLGTAAFAASRLLYSDSALDQVEIGAVVPEDDRLAGRMMGILESMDSVKSLCRFSYMKEEEAIQGLEDGRLYGVLLLPEGLVEGILNGNNPPVRVLLPENAGLEGKILGELTRSGARTLGAAQAGIYAGDHLLQTYGYESSIATLEEDLNKIYLSYSLTREDYFAQETVSAAGEVTPLYFYGISALVLYLFLEAIPLSGYMTGETRVMDQKLRLLGVGPCQAVLARLIGLTFLLTLAGLLPVLAAVWLELLSFSWLLPGMLILMSAVAASVILFLYESAGTLLGGVMLVFLTSVSMLFLSGGFIPSVFLPEGVQRAAAFLPTTVLMDCGKMAVTGVINAKVCLAAGATGLVFYILTVGVRRR